MACEIVENLAKDYAKEYAANQMINMIENAVSSFKVSVEDAANGLGISFEEYQAAKELLSKSHQEGK